jgi:hypothetical protein
MKKYLPILFFSLFTFSYALPFQAPVPGDYQCFSSEESIFDANAQDTGATLTINDDGSYTFTTNQATENGSVQATEDTTAELELEQLFQNGSSLKLQPSNDSAPYEGMFVSDKQGGMYVLLQNNNGLHIRCESPGADIAKAIQQSENPNAETTSIPNVDVGEMTVGGPLEPGDYQCISEDYSHYTDTTTIAREYVLSLYPDMGLRIIEDNTDSDLEAVFVYNQATGELSVDDHSDDRIDTYDNIILTYFFEGYYDDPIVFFKFYRDTQNQPVLYGQNIEDTSEEDIVTTLCRYAGVAQRPSPVEE